MKITIMDLLPGEEEEAVIKCNSVTPKLLELINELKAQTEEATVRAVPGTQPVQKLKASCMNWRNSWQRPILSVSANPAF